LIEAAYDLGVTFDYSSSSEKPKSPSDLLELLVSLSSSLLSLHNSKSSKIEQLQSQLENPPKITKIHHKPPPEPEVQHQKPAEIKILRDNSDTHALKKLEREFGEYKKVASAKMARYELSIKKLKNQWMSKSTVPPSTVRSKKAALSEEKSNDLGFIEKLLGKSYFSGGKVAFNGDIEIEARETERVEILEAQERRLDELMLEATKQNRYLCALFNRVFGEAEIKKYQEAHHSQLLKYI